MGSDAALGFVQALGTGRPTPRRAVACWGEKECRREEVAFPEVAYQEAVVAVEACPEETAHGTAVAGGSWAGCSEEALTSQSPAACASPSAANRSRNLPASSGLNPRMRASVDAAAVWSLMLTSPKARSIGPAATSTSCMRP